MPVDSDLHKAANNGDLIKCQEIIESGEIDVNAAGAADRRPLHRAAGANHIKIMTYLLEKGASIDLADKSGRTALHWASISGQRDAVEMLLGKDCSLFPVTSSGSTALACAAEAGKVEVVRLLLEKAQTTEKLNDLCNIKDGEGKSAFDLALAGKHKATCKLLKDMGDPNAASAACTIS